MDQIIDWFGTDIKIVPKDEHSIVVSLKASPKAMTHWAMQYIDYVEITKPASLRNKIQESLRAAQNKYQ